MSMDYNYCRQMLESVTDKMDGVADVKGYDEPRQGLYQIMCLFRYPTGQFAIDEHYGTIQQILGPDWTLKLSVEQMSGAIIARLTARLKYENGRDL